METGIKFDRPIEEYPYDMKTAIKEYLDSADTQILEFIDKHFDGEKIKFGRQKISDVSNRQSNDIKSLLGIDVNGCTNNINTNAIQHIRKRHGINGNADTSMSNEADIARVGYILENYDDVQIATNGADKVNSAEFRNSDDSPAPMLIYSKK